MSKPARNATGREAPGQIVNPVESFNRYEFLEKPIIKEKKLTFEEWLVKQNWATAVDGAWRTILLLTWKAAQENV